MEQLIFKAMGTTIKLQIQHESANYLLEEAQKRLLDYEKRFSANNDTSALMDVNQHAGIQAVKVDKDIFDLVQIGKHYSLDQTNSLNIAIGPLIKLWRIGFDGARIPTQAEIDERLPLINPENIQLSEEDHSIYLTQKGMEIDLGALAKGYFADKIKTFLMSAGVEKGIIDLGGNVLLIGAHPSNPDELWRVGIQSPFKTRNNIVGLIPLKDVSIVTSGIYERSFVINEEEYHHIFDSQTGYPIHNDIASITIVSNKSLTGELYTTMLFNNNSQEALALMNQTPEIEGLVITRSGDILTSNGLRNRFVAVNS